MSSSDGQDTSGPLSEHDVTTLQVFLIEIAIVGVAYGTFLILAILATHALIRQGLRESRARLVLQLLLILMFSVSTTFFGVTITFLVIQIRSLSVIPYDPLALMLKLEIILVVLPRMTYILGDAIVVWRAWILFSRQPIFCIILAICMMGSTVCAFVDGGLNIRDLIESPLTADSSLGVERLRLLLPLFITNVVATGFVWYKTWTFRKQVKILWNEYNKQTRSESVLKLLVESGCIYCFVWALTIIAALGPIPIQVDAALVAVIPHITYIYPTLIIYLVSLQKSQNETTYLGDISRPIQFASSRPVDHSGSSTSEPNSNFMIPSRMMDSTSSSDLDRHREPAEMSNRAEEEEIGTSEGKQLQHVTISPV
ncbi:hypothetical protein K435DRAFT_809497 [Dendrothele bispora CBS 962.96]|uniref:Uncharacterized protein n=1 Tax=Dendrothele bispora (strain CBS 962.96) TaxID=1314807 RepID=A0A4S8KYH1_DENBC|nr:hypothetical protein K435DRAFT_809497 [Dendrothele bispora CBS 962.96]